MFRCTFCDKKILKQKLFFSDIEGSPFGCWALAWNWQSLEKMQLVERMIFFRNGFRQKLSSLFLNSYEVRKLSAEIESFIVSVFTGQYEWCVVFSVDGQ